MPSVPAPDRFVELADRFDVVPVRRELTADAATPLALWRILAATGRNPFLLESVEGGERVARFSFVGADPCRIVEIRGGTAYVDGAPVGGTPLDVLRRESDWGRVPPLDEFPPFCGGAVGYLGYDAVRTLENIPDTCTDEDGLGEAWFGLYDTIVALDRARQRLVLVTAARIGGDPTGAWRRAEDRLDALERKLAGAGTALTVEEVPPVGTDPWEGWRPAPGDEAFLGMVRSAREEILAGEIFQVVLSRRWRRMPRTSAVEIYRMLRLTNPSPYMFLFDTGRARVLGASPEMLVRVRGGVATTCPIAGTRPRGAGPDEDRRLEAELLADPKERAEHVMLVDLGRNDIGRVSVPGSVRIVREMDVERYSHVMHMVSEVSGRLREDVDAWEALAACFPAGTLSGAPKVRAMEIIDELEGVRRGVYGGAVGYRNINGDLDSCIAIRTLVERGGTVVVQAGAGIVYDSIPENELAECANKARALVEAVSMAEELTRRR
ncbi:MAG: anthranilate synthase component I family protein [Acidobacteria bacterium]|nr:anthranilate synthase component I family protein [Acidobacteriota bacterium]